MDRTIHLRTLRNGRDLGGLVGAEGRPLRRGLLLRSANLSETSEEDMLALARDWKLRLVIDLRMTLEREQMPDQRAPGVEFEALPIFDDVQLGVTHEKPPSEAFRVPAMPDLARIYRKMTVEESRRVNLAKSVRRVMGFDFSEGSVLWHCSEGKDRCGLLSAVLLSALGVDRAQVMDDYLMTNLVNEARSRQFYQDLIDAGRSPEQAEMVRRGTLALPEYMQTIFDSVDELYGGMEGYLHEGLGIEDELIASFREKVLE